MGLRYDCSTSFRLLALNVSMLSELDKLGNYDKLNPPSGFIFSLVWVIYFPQHRRQYKIHGNAIENL